MNAHGKFLDQIADWPYLTEVPAALQEGEFSPLTFRQVLDQGTELLKDRFVADEPIEDLVRDRARLVDIALRAAWVNHAGTFTGDLALVAVGGYGRGELHPSSDIDIMVLLPKSDSSDWQPDIERFLTFLWDIGLEVGHSVRSIDDCQRESLADISVATTLFEARLLAGPEPLFAGMRRALAPDRLWSSQDFFEAKVKEQTERHHRYFDTAYNLEPNVKSSPGGLRDIQTIGWVAKRHFGTDTLDELVPHGFLTRDELRKLQAAQSFLWKVRFGLHMLTGRREDRLLFDYQIKLAKLFGYEDASFTLAVEQLMQKYYRTVMDVSLLNEMLLQLFREAILTQSAAPIPINARFQIRNDYLEVTHPEVFARSPAALLEMFVLLQQNPELVLQRVAFEGENYFQNPSLLEFIAENPVRYGRLPSNILEITRTLLAAKPDQLALNDTLGLVASGRVARESGMKIPLLELLSKSGADPNVALHAAASHGEFDALKALLQLGAKSDLATLAALGETEDFSAQLAASMPEQRQLALAGPNTCSVRNHRQQTHLRRRICHWQARNHSG